MVAHSPTHVQYLYSDCCHNIRWCHWCDLDVHCTLLTLEDGGKSHDSKFQACCLNKVWEPQLTNTLKAAVVPDGDAAVTKMFCTLLTLEPCWRMVAKSRASCVDPLGYWEIVMPGKAAAKVMEGLTRVEKDGASKIVVGIATTAATPVAV